jgi:hypothetical protein
MSPPPAGAELDLHADVLVARQRDGADRVGERVHAGQHGAHVDPALGDRPHRVLEHVGEAERAAHVELAGHDQVGVHVEAVGRQRADLDDRAAAADGLEAGGERRRRTGHLERDVGLAHDVGQPPVLRQPVGAHRQVGADPARDLERVVDHVGDRDVRGAGEPDREGHHAADRARAGDQHALAEQVAGAVRRVQRDRERLGHRDLGERHVGRHRDALLLRHQEELAERAVHVREHARAAEEAHVRAQVLASLAAAGASPAGPRGIDRDPVAGLDAGHARTGGGDDPGGLVAGDQRLADHEAAVAAVEVVVHVGAADAGRAEPDQHLAGAGLRRGHVDDPQVFGPVDLALEHPSPPVARRIPERGHGTVPQVGPPRAGAVPDTPVH